MQLQFPLSVGGRALVQAQNIAPGAVLEFISSLRLQANADFLSPISEDSTGFTFTAADLLANDGGVTKRLGWVDTTSGGGGQTITFENGVFTYDPDRYWDYLSEGMTGLQPFNYTIRDAAGHTSSTTSFFVITGVNDPVGLVNPFPWFFTVAEIADNQPGEGTSVRQASGDFAYQDPDAWDTHVLSVAPQGEGYLGTFAATFEAGQTGGAVAWTFTVDDAALEFLGWGETLTQVYEVTVSDNHGSSATKTISIDLVGRNDAPVAQNIEAAMSLFDGPLTLAPVFVDPDLHDTHTVTVRTSNAGVEVKVNPDGTFTYDPGDLFDWLPAGQSVRDVFDYAVHDDQGGTGAKQVFVVITNPNHNPDAQSINIAMNSHDGPLTIAPVFTDADAGDSHIVTIVASGISGGLSARGFTVVVNPDGTFTYDPEGKLQGLHAGETLEDRFLYEVQDDHGGVDRALVTITVTGDDPHASDWWV